mgnify:CR=1 FL=1
MSLVEKVLMAPEGPEFSKLVQGYWRLGAWNMNAQARLSFLKAHVELGITSVDHAAIYDDGACETLFGDALKLEASMRDKIEIITKFGINGQAEGNRVAHYDTRKEAILTSVDQSLTRLGVDRIDALLVHRLDYLMDADQVADAFQTLKQNGKVTHFGVSNFSVSQFELLQSRLDMPLITNQVEINPMQFDALENGACDQLQQYRIRPMAWSCLTGGKIFNEQTLQAKRLRDTLSEIQSEIGATSIEQVMLTWVLKHPSAPIALLGSGKLDRTREAISALELKINNEQWYRIWVASKGFSVP